MRENRKENEFDKDYHNLLKAIRYGGVEVENRTGINTIKIPSYELHFDLSKEFPILSTKQLFYKHAVLEMLWIWQAKSNDVRWLQKRGVKIWNEWMVDEDGIYRIYEPYGPYDPDKEVEVRDPLSVPISDPFGKRHKFDNKKDAYGNVIKAKSLIPGKTIKAAIWYGPQLAHTNGKAYGYFMDRYAHPDNLIYSAKYDPTDRRIVKSWWQDEFIREAVLPPCVWSSEWDITDGKLNLLLHQRSCDVPLGLPFNVTQYAVLLLMMAQVTNLKPGTIHHSIKDAHIYVNQMPGVDEQIRRYERKEELSLMSDEELYKIQNYVKDRKDKIEDKNSKEYELLDTEDRTIDMILEPTTPEMVLNSQIDDFFKFDNSKDIKDLKLLNYKHMGKINFPIAQ